MFMDIEFGRSYLWLLPVLVAAGIFAGVGLEIVANVLPGLADFLGPVPLFLGFVAPLWWLAICQLRSGFAINSMWRATGRRGTLAFKLSIGWGIGAPSAFVVIIAVAHFSRM